MNVAGIGIDAVDIKRFEKTAGRGGDRFLKKIFTDKELKYSEKKKERFAHMAGKFAAKEAVKKALPDGARIGLSWTDIEIVNDEDGKPHVVLHGKAKELQKEFSVSDVFLSISHSQSVAVSNAVVVKNGS